MKDSVRNFIAGVVRQSPEPTLRELASADAPGFAALQSLLAVVTSLPLAPCSIGVAGEVVFHTQAGHPLLTARLNAGSWTVEGEATEALTKFLSAIRVHEVDSYEWVYLPPELRRSFVSKRAAAVGASEDEFQKLMQLWTRT